MNCKDCLNMKVTIPLSKGATSLLTARLLYSAAKASCIKGRTNISIYDYGKASKQEREDGYKSWQLEDDCLDFISMYD